MSKSGLQTLKNSRFNYIFYEIFNKTKKTAKKIIIFVWYINLLYYLCVVFEAKKIVLLFN